MLHKHCAYIIQSMSPRTERKVSHKFCMLVLLVLNSSQKFSRLLWNGVCKLINDTTNIVAWWDLVQFSDKAELGGGMVVGSL